MAKKEDIVDVLIAEDDEDDYLLISDAVKEAHVTYRLHRVKDGIELMDYLLPQSSGKEKTLKPRLILLDLNLPRKNGREALEEIRANPELRKIPVVVLTTSDDKDDIFLTYDLGVNSFIRKPIQFDQMVSFFKVFEAYWFKFAKLPQVD